MNAPLSELEKNIVALLNEKGACSGQDLCLFLGMEDPGERDRVAETLKTLRVNRKISLTGKKYCRCQLTEAAVLNILDMHGPLRTPGVLRLLGGSGRVDGMQLSAMLRQLQREGRLVRVKNRWCTAPDITADNVLSLLSHASKDMPSLLACFGGNSAKTEKCLLDVLQRLEEEQRVCFKNGRWKANKKEHRKLRGGHEDKGRQAADHGPRKNLRSDTLVRGVYMPERGQAMLRLDNPAGRAGFCVVRSSPLPLLPGDSVEARLSGVKDGRHQICDVTRLIKPAQDLHLQIRLDDAVHPDSAPILRGRALQPARYNTWLGDTADLFVIEKNKPGAAPMDHVQARVLYRTRDCIGVEVVSVDFRFDSIWHHEALARLNHETPQEFPDAALREVESLPARLDDKAMRKRADLRGLPFVTIDGDMAMDFDDAVCVEKKAGGTFILHVAIADVSFYVRPGSALDKEALRRGNSRYFPTSVDPMLPRRLSDDLCSLLPGRDRPVLRVRMEIEADGRLTHAAFGLGLINSYARLTYDQALCLVLEGDASTCEEFYRECPYPEAVLTMLGHARELAGILAEKRRRKGALDLNLSDIEARFDEDGSIISLAHARRHDMHRLIEEFMIQANEAVAEFLRDRDMPFLFRVHEAPSGEKLLHFQHILQRSALFGGDGTRPGHPRLQPAVGAAVSAGILAGKLRSLRGSPQESVFARLCVRALPRAVYSPENIGHYGLASEAYCHFTSPIRRYADLLTHRALKMALQIDHEAIPTGRRLMRTADILNRCEKNAQETEREMQARCACMWMQRQPMDKVWTASVSGVQPGGAFVTLDEVPVVGFVPVNCLAGRDLPVYHAHDECLSDGKRIHVRPGSRVTVRLKSIDPVRLYITFTPA